MGLFIPDKLGVVMAQQYGSYDCKKGRYREVGKPYIQCLCWDYGEAFHIAGEFNKPPVIVDGKIKGIVRMPMILFSAIEEDTRKAVSRLFTQHISSFDSHTLPDAVDIKKAESEVLFLLEGVFEPGRTPWEKLVADYGFFCAHALWRVEGIESRERLRELLPEGCATIGDEVRFTRKQVRDSFPSKFGRTKED
jgi:hypothetical protein